MNTWKLEIEYDGTRYYGWRIAHDSKTVQGELSRAGRDLFSGKLEIGAAEPTDAGVHAIHQVAHLKVSELTVDVRPKQIMEGFNELLPHDIKLLHLQTADENFHARKEASSRQYLYKISQRRTAFSKNFLWWVKDELDVKKMKNAAEALIGKHDFTSFSFIDEDYKNDCKTLVKHAEVLVENELICFRIEAERFFPKMVRRIVGMLVEVGRGKLADTAFERMLRFPTDAPRKFAAPASGLFLEKIKY